MSTFRRKSDQVLSQIPGHPDEVLEELVAMYKKLDSFKKEGYKIMAYKERSASYILKEID